eukprot:11103-Eustigmatos_ZCMA.PRE.1
MNIKQLNPLLCTGTTMKAIYRDECEADGRNTNGDAGELLRTASLPLCTSALPTYPCHSHFSFRYGV